MCHSLPTAIPVRGAAAARRRQRVRIAGGRIDRHRAVGAPPDQVSLAVAVDVARARRRPAEGSAVDHREEAGARACDQRIRQRHGVAAARQVEFLEPADAAELRRRNVAACGEDAFVEEYVRWRRR